MTTQEYQLSPRITLAPGDSIRVSQGPYVRLKDGRKAAMAAKGLYRLLEVIHDRSRVYLLAHSKTAGYAILHVAGRRRNRVVPGLVCRPYKIKRAGQKAKARVGY